MTPAERKALHEACPCASQPGPAHCWFAFFQPTKCKCSIGGYGETDCRWKGHALIDSLPDAPGPLPAVDTHLAQQWLNECEGLSLAKAIFHCTQAALADRKAAVDEANRQADAHYEAKMEELRKFAEAGVRTAVDAALAEQVKHILCDILQKIVYPMGDCLVFYRLESDRAARIARVEEAATMAQATLERWDGNNGPAGISDVRKAISAIVAAAKGEA